MGLEPGRKAKAGDMALVRGVRSSRAGKSSDTSKMDGRSANGLTVEVISDPEFRPLYGKDFNFCIAPDKGKVWIETACLIPITPDEDTKKQFNAEMLDAAIEDNQDRLIRSGKL